MSSSPSSRISRSLYLLTALLLLASLAVAQSRPRYWSTFVGGGADDRCESVVIAANGDLIVAGQTASPGLKVSANAYQPKIGGQHDVFVARLTGDGKTLLALTYLGGTTVESTSYLYAAKDGSIWVGGSSVSTNFPTTTDAWSRNSRSANDAFLVQFDGKLTTMLYGTMFNGTAHAYGTAFHVDETNKLLYIAGICSGQVSTTAGALRSTIAGQDAYLAVLDRSVVGKTTLQYGSYIGGTGTELSLDALSVSAKGVVTLTGTTRSTDLPVTTGALMARMPGAPSGFVQQVDPKISGAKGLVHGSYLGGSAGEEACRHIQGPQGLIHVLLTSLSSDLPTTKNAVLGRGQSADCYYASLDTSKSGAASLLFGSWIINGGNADGSTWGRTSLALHPKGIAFFATTISAWWSLPTLPGAFQQGLRGSMRGYIVLLDTKSKVDPFIAYNSEYGDMVSGLVEPWNMVVHSSGDLILTGAANKNLPMLPSAMQSKFGGATRDGFVARFEPRDWGSRFLSLGAACKGSAGIPKLAGLAASIGSRNGNAGSLTAEASGMAPKKICAFLLGSHKDWLSIPLPLAIGKTGCTLQASPILIFPFAVNSAGKATLKIPLPLDPKLFGAQVAVQTFIIDPTANASKLVLTNGLLAEIGW